MRRLGVLFGVVALLVLTGTEAQAAPTPGSGDGVKAVASHGKIVFVFTKKPWKRVAGREVTLECVQTPLGTPGEGVKAGAAEDFKAPKSGLRLKSGFKTGRYDLCSISEARRGTVALIPLTQKGAVFEDEALFAGDLLGIAGLADSLSTGGHFPPADQVVAKGGGSVVALAAPTDTPPAGKYGIYSDGNQHIAAVVLSSAGRRLFFEVAGDTVSTNVLAQINFITGT
jgi:hypothetical protein